MTLAVGEKVPYCSVGRETGPVLSVHSVTLAALRCLKLIDNWPPTPKMCARALFILSKASQVATLPNVHWRLQSENFEFARLKNLMAVYIWFHTFIQMGYWMNLVNMICWCYWPTIDIHSWIEVIKVLNSSAFYAELFSSYGVVQSRLGALLTEISNVHTCAHLLTSCSHILAYICHAHVLQNMHNMVRMVNAH